MRILLIAAAAALLMLPAARQAKACELDAYAAEAGSGACRRRRL